MDLEKTIAELEAQAAKYTAAANTLRQLQSGPGATASQALTQRQSSNTADTAAKTRKKSGKRFVSPETRAKLAASMKARHQKKREDREQQAAAQPAA